MNTLPWTIHDLRRALASGTLQPTALAETALAHMNQNAGRNTYIWQDAAWTRAEAARAAAMPRGSGGPFGDGRPALWGLPISVKDLFDLAGSPTSCGVHFYRDVNGIATRDSWLVEQLRAASAVIIGKTHLHALAFGITGENPDYGDCLQPADRMAFTGGSSSGAAASVQEGSAVAAIGTDTGGSIRVPAALCGLAGYRASRELAHERGLWRGGVHLADSFDTLGWLFRDLRDAPLLAAALFDLDVPAAAQTSVSIGVAGREFLDDCEPVVKDCFKRWQERLGDLGAEFVPVDSSFWEDAMEVYAFIQASEAAAIHMVATG